MGWHVIKIHLLNQILFCIVCIAQIQMTVLSFKNFFLSSLLKGRAPPKLSYSAHPSVLFPFPLCHHSLILLFYFVFSFFFFCFIFIFIFFVKCSTHFFSTILFSLLPQNILHSSLTLHSHQTILCLWLSKVRWTPKECFSLFFFFFFFSFFIPSVLVLLTCCS